MNNIKNETLKNRYTLFINKEEYNDINSEEKIKIGSQDIYIKYLKKLLSDDTYFEYISKYFKGEIKNFSLQYIENEKLNVYKFFNKVQIINAIEKLINNEKIILNSKETKRYNLLKHYISIEYYINNNPNYNIKIQEKKYCISTKNIIFLMNLPDEKFNNILYNEQINQYFGIDKKHFLYATCMFLKKIIEFQIITIPPKILDRYIDIKTVMSSDFKIINTKLKEMNLTCNNIKLDKNMINAILDGMPVDSTNLEKALYVYIKMCKIFTYDIEYYAVGQDGYIANKHKDINYISNINVNNNEIVCYEFNVIYAKILNKLGITKSNINEQIENYGNGHFCFQFISDKYIIKADPLMSIFEGDMIRAKLSQTLIGLECVNADKKMLNDFKKSVLKMYKIIIKQENNNKIIEEYFKLINNTINLDLEKKLLVFMQAINLFDLKGIDKLAFIIQLKKILFNSQERKNNIKIIIVRTNKTANDKKASAIPIFVTNKYSFKEFPKENNYYYLDKDLVCVLKENIKKDLDSGILQYIENDSQKIYKMW